MSARQPQEGSSALNIGPCSAFHSAISTSTAPVPGESAADLPRLSDNTLSFDQLVSTLAGLVTREAGLLLSISQALSDRDPLTGLLNHRAFQKQFQDDLQRFCAADRPLALLLFDLNDFRFLNETYGHDGGDALLCRVGQMLSGFAEEQGGEYPARYGGDEFALLLPDSSLDQATEVAKALADCLRRLEYCPPGHDTAIPITASVGYACCPDDGVGSREMLAAANDRLRRAKAGTAENDHAERLRALLTRAVEGFSMLDALVTAVDSKDRYTRHHSEDVLFYCLKIAEALGLGQAEQETLAVAALLHDIGKIGVPDHILRKPGSLTEDEFSAISHHPLMGAVIVGAVPGFEESLDAIRHHHERWDGKGYPFGLRAQDIPHMARLMAVADAFSAMTTDRPYRKGMRSAKALAILEAGAGTQWDPECVDALRQACLTGAF